MIKSLLLIRKVTFILFILSAIVSNAQNLTVVYELSFQPDSTDSRVFKEDMILLIEKKSSRFSSRNNILYQDSLSPILAKQAKATGAINLMGMALPRTEFYFNIFKNTGTQIVYDYVQGQTYRYTEPGKLINWAIQSETQTIAGYSCQKATGRFAGRNYTAWFSTDIPVSDGPYKFNGLPGLIVKIEDATKSYGFQLIKLMKQLKYKVQEPTGTIVNSTKKELVLLEKKRKENPVQSLLQMGSFNLSPEDIKRIKAQAQKQNNPIELTAE